MSKIFKNTKALFTPFKNITTYKKKVFLLKELTQQL